MKIERPNDVTKQRRVVKAHTQIMKIIVVFGIEFDGVDESKNDFCCCWFFSFYFPRYVLVVVAVRRLVLIAHRKKKISSTQANIKHNPKQKLGLLSKTIDSKHDR